MMEDPMDSNQEAPRPEEAIQPAPADPSPGAPNVGAPVGPGPTAMPPLKPRRNRWLDVALGLAAVVAVAGIAFAAGRLTAPQPTFGLGANFGANGGGSAPGSSPGAGFRGGLGGTIALEGTITAVSADQLTLKLDSGQTVTVPLNAATAYHRQAAAGSADVQSGSKVLVQLQSSASGGGGIQTGQLAPAANVTLVSP
jgi:hypothetical protein